jgi:MFS family permease
MRAPSAAPGAATITKDGSLLEKLKSEPAASVALEALRRWWEQYPLQTAAKELTQSLRAVLVPIAQRNPLGLVLAAFLAGGLVTLAKPWRWMSLQGIFLGALPQILAKVVAQVPVATWLDRGDASQRPGTEREDDAPS